MSPPTRITVGKNLGLHVSWFVYRGPGHVTLQTLPFSRTARRVLAAAGSGRDEVGAGGILGGILGE